MMMNVESFHREKPSELGILTLIMSAYWECGLVALAMLKMSSSMHVDGRHTPM
jgi:hypothetical protein